MQKCILWILFFKRGKKSCMSTCVELSTSPGKLTMKTSSVTQTRIRLPFVFILTYKILQQRSVLASVNACCPSKLLGSFSYPFLHAHTIYIYIYIYITSHLSCPDDIIHILISLARDTSPTKYINKQKSIIRFI